MPQLVVGTYNLERGGIDHGDRTRLRGQLAMLNDVHPEVWSFQECGWQDDEETLDLVERTLGMRGYFARSNQGPECDVAVFIREDADIRVIQERHETRYPYYHAVAHVLCDVDGFGLLRLASAHLAPASPTLRLIEAESFQLIAEQGDGPLIVGGDFNAFPVGYPDPDLTGVHPGVADRKRDTRAAAALEQWMVSVARHLGNTTPTAGHRPDSNLRFPPDGIYTTLPPESIQECDVPKEDGEPASDHKPFLGVFDLTAA